jgi:hypothetical protein
MAAKKITKKKTPPNKKGGVKPPIKTNTKQIKVKKKSAAERKANEKIRIAKITATWAKKNYKKSLEIKNPTKEQRLKRRQDYERLLKLNSKVIDLIKKKPSFKKLTKKKGWVTQNFGLPQRFEINFLEWFERNRNAFSKINDFNLPKHAGLLLIYVSDLALNSTAYMELELKYQYDTDLEKNFGILYTIDTNED